MRPLPLFVSIAAVLGSAQALATPPTQPGDLRADVYSGTAAELFWSRSSDPDGAVRAYEVRRDGELVATLDGLSYFTDALRDGQAASFTITAIDFDGERSASASVSVVGGDRDGAVGAGGGLPTPPSNLTSSVYSSSAAEVFWDRSDQSGLTYEVAVDSGPVVTTSGTSAFLSGLDSTRGRGVDVLAIDANGQRSGAANVTLGGGGSSGDDPDSSPSGEAPPAPANLSAEVYSTDAAELFWDRAPETNLRYEVSRDAEIIATTDGTSRFVSGLSLRGETFGGGEYVFDVVAIDVDGRRSNASRIALNTRTGTVGKPSDTQDLPSGAGDVSPAPANARIEVYSGTAAELFWDRAAVTDDVDVTRIRRDGVVLGLVDGTSFFDGSRQEGQRYRYEIAFVDTAGDESDSAIVGEELDPGASEQLVLDADSYQSFLAELLPWVNGVPVDRLIDRFDRLWGTAESGPAAAAQVPDGLQLVSAVVQDDGQLRAELACTGGGTVVFDELPSNFSTTGGGSLIFENCRIGEERISGRGSRRYTSDGRRTQLEGFRVVAANGTDATIFARQERIEAEDGRLLALEYDDVDITLREPEGKTQLTQYTASLSFDSDSGEKRFGAAATIEGAPWSRQQDVRFGTGPIDQFQRLPSSSFYENGNLNVSLGGADGLQQNTLSADSGTSETFVFTINARRADERSFEVVWGERFGLACLAGMRKAIGPDCR